MLATAQRRVACSAAQTLVAYCRRLQAMIIIGRKVIPIETDCPIRRGLQHRRSGRFAGGVEGGVGGKKRTFVHSTSTSAAAVLRDTLCRNNQAWDLHDPRFCRRVMNLPKRRLLASAGRDDRRRRGNGATADVGERIDFRSCTGDAGGGLQSPSGSVFVRPALRTCGQPAARMGYAVDFCARRSYGRPKEAGSARRQANHTLADVRTISGATSHRSATGLRTVHTARPLAD